ncbi:MAG: hypothetical protein FWE03_05695 [Firmicutes bacterium]|nr:hypothetical protein [Bacillota bacterium]
MKTTDKERTLSIKGESSKKPFSRRLKDNFGYVLTVALIVAMLSISVTFLAIGDASAFVPPVPSAPVNSNDVSTFFLGHGTENNPFQLRNRQDLNTLSIVVSDTAQPRWDIYRRAGTHFRLMNNIDLGGSLNPWRNTIGRMGTTGQPAPFNTAAPFRGTFDGAGHTISNLFLSESMAPVNNFGLFGYTQDANIRNLNIQSVTISLSGEALVSNAVAPLIGRAGINTHVSFVNVIGGNISASGNPGVEATRRAGGLIGESVGTNNSNPNRIFASSSTVGVSAYTYVGGLIGRAQSTAVNQTFATGNITASSTGAIVGGLIGELNAQNSTGGYIGLYAVVNSFASGGINTTAMTAVAPFAAGGLVGRASTATTMIMYSYASGVLVISAESGTVRAGGLVGHASAATRMVSNAAVNPSIQQTGGTRHIGRLATVNAAADRNQGANNHSNLINLSMSNPRDIPQPFVGMYSFTAPPAAPLAAPMMPNQELLPSTFNEIATWESVGFNFTYIWHMPQGTNTLPALRVFSSNDSAIFRGNGTELNPFQIRTADCLIYFRDMVNAGDRFAGNHFRMMQNINIPVAEANWMPIGITASRSFRGTFDGGGFRISGIDIEHHAFRAPQATNNGIGLFGHIAYGAVIRNLTLYQPRIRVTTSSYGVGALVGHAIGTGNIIENIRVVDADILNAGRRTGTVVGDINSGSTIIRNVSAHGTVGGRYDVGGILGANFGTGLIERVEWDGLLHRNLDNATFANPFRGTAFGGIVGSNRSGALTITNAIAAGDINHTSPVAERESDQNIFIGGIVGWNADNITLNVSNSIFAGGEMIGRARPGVNIGVMIAGIANGNFAAAATSRLPGVIQNNVVAPSRVVAYVNRPEDARFSEITYQRTAPTAAQRINNLIFDGILMQMRVGDNAYTTLVNQTITGQRAANGTRTLNQLTSGPVYTLGIAQQGLGWDVQNVWQVGGGWPRLRSLVGTYGDAVFRGDGSALRPFVIDNATQLHFMRDQVNLGNTFMGLHFRLGQNIDLQGVDWVPIGTTTANPFQGTFDGNHRTIFGLRIVTRRTLLGLFGYTLDATIRNLTIHDPYVRQLNGATGDRHGFLIGRADGRLNIQNVRIEGGFMSTFAGRAGSILGYRNSGAAPVLIDQVSSSALIEFNQWAAYQQEVGGLIGRADASVSHGITISRSFFDGEVFHTRTTGHDIVVWQAGIVAVISNYLMSETANFGQLNGGHGVQGGIGGLIGHSGGASSTVRNSYNIGNIVVTHTNFSGSSHRRVAGIIGHAAAGNLSVYNVFNSGELYVFNGGIRSGVWGVRDGNDEAMIAGIIGANLATTTMRGVVSAGQIMTTGPTNLRSRAWFVNSSTAATSPDGRLGQTRNNLFYQGLTMRQYAINTLAGQAPIMFHRGPGTASASSAQLRNLATYANIGWDINNIWTINPNINNGFPHLRGMPISPLQSNDRAHEIHSHADFLEFRNSVNRGMSFAGMDIRVYTNLDLSAYPNWNPIGNEQQLFFGGRIDFQGHSITGLRHSSQLDNRGLFGWIANGAEIRNLTMFDVNFIARDQVASVVSRIHNVATIENVHVAGNSSVAGRHHAAGAISHINDAYDVVINNVTSTANVRATGGRYAGGLISYANSYAGATGTGSGENYAGSSAAGFYGGVHITNSLATGDVISNSSEVGGFIGRADRRVLISRSYAAGMVRGTSQVGGFIGTFRNIFSVISDSFAVGSVIGSGGDIGGFVGSVEAAGINTTLINIYARGRVRTTATANGNHLGGVIGRSHVNAFYLNTQGLIAINPSISGPQSANQLGRLGTASGMAGIINAEDSAVALDMRLGRVNTPNVFMPDEGSLAFTHNSDRLPTREFLRFETWTSRGFEPSVWVIDPLINDGFPVLRGLRFNHAEMEGSGVTPVTISNLTEFLHFRSRVNQGENFMGQVVQLSANIDLSSQTAWIPIGTTAANAFQGTFDGNGYFIENFNFNLTGVSNQGLFGFTTGAVFRNLNFSDVDLSVVSGTSAQLGILVGQSVSEITIENVNVISGRVTASNTLNQGGNTGGFVGLLQGSHNIISDSFIDGVTITGGSNAVGGFVGSTQSVTIERSYFAGTVTTHAAAFANTVAGVGGFIGHITNLAGVDPTVIRNATVSGTIEDVGRNNALAGGLIGRNSSLLTARVYNVFIDAHIRAAAALTGGTFSIAGGIVGFVDSATTTALIVSNVAFGRGSLTATGTPVANTRIAAPVGASHIAMGLILSHGTTFMINEGIDTFSQNHTTTTRDFISSLAANQITRLPLDQFRNEIRYFQMGWDFDFIWAIDASINEGFPYLKGSTAVPHLLTAAIEEAERLLAARSGDFSTFTIQRLETEIGLAKATIVTTGGQLSREEILIIAGRINGAVMGLRAADNGLTALVEYVETSLADPLVRRHFVTFAGVDALLVSARQILEAIDLTNGHNLIINSNVITMRNSLQSAVNALQINMQHINTLILEASSKNLEHYEANEYRAAFVHALTQAQILASQSNPQPIMVANAYIQLRESIQNLSLETSRFMTLLNSANETIDAGLQPGVEFMSFMALIAARDVALTIYNRIMAQDPTLSGALIALHEANLMSALTEVLPSNDPTRIIRLALSELIIYAHSVQSHEVSQSSWALIVTATSGAVAAMGNNASTQTQLQSAYDALRAALNNRGVNTIALTNAINNAQGRIDNARIPNRPNDPNNFFYSAPTVMDVQAAIARSQNTLNDIGNGIIPNQDANLAMTGAINDLSSNLSNLILIDTPLVNLINQLIPQTMPPNSYFFDANSVLQLSNQLASTNQILDERRSMGTLTAEFLVAQYSLLRIAEGGLSVERQDLEAAIARAESIRQDFVMADHWINVFYPVLSSARTMVMTANADANAVMVMTNNLNAAIDAIVGNHIDRTILRALRDSLTGGTYIAANFLPDTWDNFNTALTALNAIANPANLANTVTIFAAQEAYGHLVAARNTLLPNKTPLIVRIDFAQNLDTEAHTAASVAHLDAMTLAAQAVVNNQDATIHDVLEALANLNAAISALEVDNHELANLIAQVDGMNPVHFTTVSWNALITVRNAANTFLLSGSANMDQMAAHIYNLTNAIAALIVDTDTLQDLIDDVEIILEYYRDSYTAQSITNLENWLGMVLTIMDNPHTIEEIQNAVIALSGAVGSLVNIQELRYLVGILELYRAAGLSNTDLNLLVTAANTELNLGTNSQVASRVTVIRNFIPNFITQNNFSGATYAVYQVVRNGVLENLGWYNGQFIEGDKGLLVDAIANLVYVGELRELINSSAITSLVQSRFTASSWTALSGLIAKTPDMFSYADDQDDVDALIDDILAAVNNLELDRSELAAAILAAQGRNANNYTATTANALAGALSDAQSIYANSENFDEIVNTALNLNLASQNLISIVVNGVNLRDLIETKSQLLADSDQSEYTFASWTAITTALTNATNMVNNAGTFAMVESAFNQLNGLTLVQLPPNVVDMSALSALYTAQYALNRASANYSSGFMAWQTAMTNAYNVLNDVTSSEAVVNMAYSALNTAIGGLVQITQALSIPANVTVDGAMLNWDNVAGAVGFGIYVGGVRLTQVGMGITQFNLASLGLSTGVFMVSIRSLGDGINFNDSVGLTTAIPWTSVAQLSAPTNLSILGGMLSWTAPANSNQFVVVVGGVEHTTTATQFNLASLGLLPGGHLVQVRALSASTFFTESELSNPIVFTVANVLIAPTGLIINNGILTFNAVANAVGYRISFNGQTHNISGTSFVLPADLSDGTFTITVIALGDNYEWTDSPDSYILFIVDNGEIIPQTTLAAPSNIRINGGNTLIWDYDGNALSFEIRIRVNGSTNAVHIVNTNSFSIENLTLIEGTNIIDIRAIGDGQLFLDSAFSTYVSITIDADPDVDPIIVTQLSAPVITSINGLIANFSTVANAYAFEIEIQGRPQTIVITDMENFDLSTVGLSAGAHSLRVRALAASDSVFSTSNWSVSAGFTVIVLDVSALGGLISQSQNIINTQSANYAVITITALQTELALALGVYNDPANQTQINAAYDALRAVFNGLINISALQSAINTAQNRLNTVDGRYTPASILNVTTYLGLANIRLSNPTSQDLVDSARQNLLNALNDLEALTGDCGNYIWDCGCDPFAAAVLELAALIAHVENTISSMTNFSYDSFSNLINALIMAQFRHANPESIALVNEAYSVLRTAYEGLVINSGAGATVERGALQALAGTVTVLLSNTHNYTAASTNAMLGALAAANVILSDEYASQEDINNAYSALRTAFNARVENDPATGGTTLNVSALISLVGSVTIILNNNHNYTVASVQAMQGALAAANMTLTAAGSTQNDINNAYQALRTAFDSRVENDTTGGGIGDTVDRAALLQLVTQITTLLSSPHNYTLASVSSMQSALASANMILTDASASQEAVDSAYDSLRSAFNARQMNESSTGGGEEPLETAALIALIGQLNTLLSTAHNYTAASVSAIQGAIASASLVLGDEYANQDDIDNAYNALRAAFNARVENDTTGGTNNVDIALLSQLVGQVTMLISGTHNYTPQSINAILGALVAANMTLGNSNSTQTDVNNAYDALRAAFNARVENDTTGGGTGDEIDAAALMQLIGQITILLNNPHNYTVASVLAMQSALASASIVLGNADAVQDDINNAYDALRAVFNNRQENDTTGGGPILDTAALMQLMGQINTILTSTHNYTIASVNAMQGALNSAALVLSNDDATQDDVNNAYLALRSAFNSREENQIVGDLNVSALVQLMSQISFVLNGTHNYTFASVLAMENALNDADAVLNNSSSVQDDINDAYTALRSAFNARETNQEDGLNVSALITLVSQAAILLNTNANNYTDASIEAIYQARNAAVYALENAYTQDQINAAYDALRYALNNRESTQDFETGPCGNLVEDCNCDEGGPTGPCGDPIEDCDCDGDTPSLDTENLVALVGLVSYLLNNPHSYTIASITAMSNALTAANNALTNPDSTQDDINYAYAALRYAFDAREVFESEFNVSALLTLISQAAMLVESDHNYTAESIAAIEVAILAAVLALEYAESQDDINYAYAALRYAFDNRQEIEGGVVTPPTGGFIGFILDNWMILVLALAGVMIVVFVAIMIAKMKGGKKKQKALLDIKIKAKEALNQAFEQLNSAGIAVINCDNNPACMESQGAAMEQLKNTDEAMKNAEELVQEYLKAKKQTKGKKNKSPSPASFL